MCVGCNPGAVKLGLSNIYEGLLSSSTAALMGQTAPGPVLSFPINGTEVSYVHFPAEQQQFFFPPSPSHLYPDHAAAHCWG